MYQACLRPVAGIANLIACAIVIRSKVARNYHRRIASHAGIRVGVGQTENPFVDEKRMIFVAISNLHELAKVPQIHEVKLMKLEAISRVTDGD